MQVISKLKFRYLLVIYFLSTEFLLLTEDFVSTMGKKSSNCLYLGTYTYTDGDALKKKSPL